MFWDVLLATKAVTFNRNHWRNSPTNTTQNIQNQFDNISGNISQTLTAFS